MAITSAAGVSTPGFVPATQRAWRIVRKGEPTEALVLDNAAPVPTLEPGQVLVRVQAVGFNNVYALLTLPLTERGLLTSPAACTFSWSSSPTHG